MSVVVTLPVQGMTCGGCENAVSRAVGMMAGVSRVQASHTSSEVVVTYDPAVVTPADISAKIGRLGYTVP